MTKDEALKLALEALELSADAMSPTKNVEYDYEVFKELTNFANQAITAIKEALAQPEQKYRRGNRLICLETEEFCVIHISGTDRQWVKFPDSHIGVYTNEQVAELFELLPKEPEQEPVAFEMDWPDYHAEAMGCGLEDRNITDRYEAMQYGWDEAIERIAERLPEVLYTTPPPCQTCEALARTVMMDQTGKDV